MIEDAPRVPRESLDRFREGVRVIHRELEREIAEIGPVCEISGRCCRFKEYGHDLFVSQPEAELLVADAGPPARPLDDGETCPWQDRLGRCVAREARPIGCRVFYCDPRFEPRSAEIGERAVNALKRLVVALDLPWNYAPLHRRLRPLLGDLEARESDPPEGASRSSDRSEFEVNKNPS